MTPFDRIDPNGTGGTEAKRLSAGDRGKRLAHMSSKPWGKFLVGIVVQIVLVLAVASLLFWALTRLRGY